MVSLRDVITTRKANPVIFIGAHSLCNQIIFAAIIVTFCIFFVSSSIRKKKIS